MSTIADLSQAMENIAPTCLAESWDNVGLLAGDPAQRLSRALLTIDYTPAVADEAVGQRCDAVIAYHPPIFHPIKRLTAGSVVFDAIRRGIALYSPHTALDVADGGTNDVLADAVGLADRQPLRRSALQPWHYKLVTFVPLKDLELLASTLFAAGAGCIGNYSNCSYRSDGVGTFLPHQGARPTIGTIGNPEYVQETRLEVIVPAQKVDKVVAALREAHPYEEPAFDLLQLTSPPTGLGMGRIGSVAPVDRADLIARIKQNLRIGHLLVAGPATGIVNTIACGAGDCGSLSLDAMSQKAEFYLTGEMKHHAAIAASASGMTVCCVLHSNSERVTLKRLANRLQAMLTDVQFVVSSVDRDPFAIL